MINITFEVRLQGFLVFCLLLSIELVEGNCRNTTLRLLDDQIQAIQKSVRTIVNERSCTSNKGMSKFEIPYNILYNNTIFNIRYMGKENEYINCIM